MREEIFHVCTASEKKQKHARLVFSTSILLKLRPPKITDAFKIQANCIRAQILSGNFMINCKLHFAIAPSIIGMLVTFPDSGIPPPSCLMATRSTHACAKKMSRLRGSFTLSRVAFVHRVRAHRVRVTDNLFNSLAMMCRSRGRCPPYSSYRRLCL